jgi:hypothetical protein
MVVTGVEPDLVRAAEAADVGDQRPVARVDNHGMDHWPQKVISFATVPEGYRSAAKAYAKYLLAAKGRSIGTLIGNIRYMARFLKYWLMR